jgi:predicted  nucleic acid-binding Zn-ribbon protein
MDTEKILLALEERDRWKDREADLEREMKELPKEEKKQKQKELTQIREQVVYYDALAKDMKKSVRPSKLSNLLNALIAP